MQDMILWCAVMWCGAMGTSKHSGVQFLLVLSAEQLGPMMPIIIVVGLMTFGPLLLMLVQKFFFIFPLMFVVPPQHRRWLLFLALAMMLFGWFNMKQLIKFQTWLIFDYNVEPANRSTCNDMPANPRTDFLLHMSCMIIRIAAGSPGLIKLKSVNFQLYYGYERSVTHNAVRSGFSTGFIEHRAIFHSSIITICEALIGRLDGER